MKYNVRDLPEECYSVRPMDFGLLDKGQDVLVIIIERGATGFYSTQKYINSIEQLKELNMVRFGISDDNVRRIMQDHSVFGNWGFMRMLNEEVA